MDTTDPPYSSCTNDSNVNVDTDIVVVDVPVIAIEWTLLYSVTSNVEVARISNVCRTWRHVAKSILLQQGSGKLDVQTRERLHRLQHQPPQVLLPPPPLLPPPLLLFASMLQNVFLSHQQHEQQLQQQQNALSSDCSTTTVTDSLQPPPIPGRNNLQLRIRRAPNHNNCNIENSSSCSGSGRVESFCVAWFAPTGIRHVHLHSLPTNSDQQLQQHDENEDDKRQGRLQLQQLQQQQSTAESLSAMNVRDNNLDRQSKTTGDTGVSQGTMGQGGGGDYYYSSSQPHALTIPRPSSPSPTAVPPPPPPPAVTTGILDSTTATTTTTTWAGSAAVVTQTSFDVSAAELVVEPVASATAASSAHSNSVPQPISSNSKDEHDDTDEKQKSPSCEPRVPGTTSIVSAAAATTNGSFGRVQLLSTSAASSRSILTQKQESSVVPPPPASSRQRQHEQAMEQTSRQGQQQQQQQSQSQNRTNTIGSRKKNPAVTSAAAAAIAAAAVPPILVTDEWRGYHTPIQVLRHFGYTRAFVEDVFQTAARQVQATAAAELAIADKSSKLLLPQPVAEQVVVQEQHAQQLYAADDVPPPILAQSAATTSSSSSCQGNMDNNNNNNNSNDTFSYQTTCAVRGAIVARPESYCLCLQEQEEKENCHDDNDNDDDLTAEINPPAAAATAIATNTAITGITAATASSISLSTSTSSRQWADIRLQEHKQALLRRQYRRHQLKLNLLPRVVLSSPCKEILFQNPTVSSAPVSLSQSSAGRNIDNNNSTSRRRGQQYSVQFLNAPGNHAVCMMTPPFACGPIPEPVTIFCIAIATEDGCFLSGLHHRFELGHLYPDSALAELTERSPICVATEGWNDYAPSSPYSRQSSCIPSKTMANTEAAAAAAAVKASSVLNHATTGASLDGGDDGNGDGRTRARTSSDRSLPFKLSSCTGDDSSMDNSDEDSAASSAMKCECIFRGVSDKTTVMDADEAMIRRGHLGPGAWHCYVAVFDGDATRIRIDGVEEEIQADDTCVPASIRGTPLEKLRHAMLDGLTIGSDHCFGMSLCCGQSGKRGEGEGAIAELAVFHGRFDQLDMNVLEQTLMDKHGIVPRGGSNNSTGSIASNNSRSDGLVTTRSNAEAAFYWQENEFHRRAHCLHSHGLQPHQIRQEMRAKGQAHAIRYDYPRPDKYPDPHVPLRCMARHDAVAWKQCDPVTGEPRQIAKIGSRLGGSSSDW